MNIIHKSLMITFGHDIKMGQNDAIKFTVESIAFVSKGKDGEISVDIDWGTDISNVSFLGNNVEGYEELKALKVTLKPLGFDLDKAVDDYIEEINLDEESDIKNELKAMWKE